MKQAATQNPAAHQPDVFLELAMITFAVLFKNYLLTDSRMIILGSRIAQEREQERENAAID